MKKILTVVLALALLLSCASFSLADEPVTLTVMVRRNAAVNVPAEENEAWKYAAEKVGVKLNFIDVDAGSWNEKFNVMLAGGDLPDIITKTNVSAVTVKENIELGTFLALNDYAEYLPNYMAVLESDPDLKALVTFGDGTIGGFAQQANYASNETKLMPTNLAIIYTPWLEAVGMEMPTTLKELYEVLKAFKEKDPNGNGVADEIPFSPLYGQGGIKLLANWFGLPIDTAQNYCGYTDGKAEFLANTESYKEFLTYFHRLWAEGLLDSEVFTQNQQQVFAKGTDETMRIGMSCSSGAAIVWGDDRAWDCDAVPLLTGATAEPVWTRRPTGYVFTGIITSKCKNVEKACELMDLFYDEDGGRLAWMGIEGVSYGWSDDGTYDFIVNEENDTTSVRAKYTLQPGGGLAAAFPEAWLKTSNRAEQWFNTFNGNFAAEYGDHFAKRYPEVTYDARDQKELDAIAADINSYVEQTMAQFITGELDIEKDWDNYVQTINNMRLDDMISIMQKGLDNL